MGKTHHLFISHSIKGLGQSPAFSGNAAWRATVDMHKPWPDPSQQVAQLKERGVRFDTFSEEDAVRYLTKKQQLL